MEITHIFEVIKDRLYVASYDGIRSILTELQDHWTDPIYLEVFFEENKTDLFSGFYGEITIEEAIEKTIEEADELFSDLLTLTGDEINELFEPLDNTEYKLIDFQKRKAKGTGYKSWLRIYAVSFYESFVITGGAIKLTKKMQDRKHTQDELDKLEMMRNLLKLNEGEHLFVYL
jgi:hypothetical protein